MKKIFKLLMLALVSSFALASCEDVPEPYPNPNGGNDQGSGVENTEVEPQGTGTLADPYNVAAVVALVSDMEADVESASVVYIKGKVATNSTSESTISQYGNMTFTMIDEGNTKTTFTAFQVYGPEKKKFTSVSQIKEGDEVVVCGKVVNFKGNTPETVGKGQSYVVSINGQGTQPAEPGAEAVEISCAKAVELCAALEDGAASVETYTVTGYITDVYSNISKGQQSFWMADTKDGGKVLQAYWANLPEGVAAFTKGSKVKITGQLLKYVKDGNVTTEIKNADVVILEEGSGDNTGGTEQPVTGEAKGDGTLANPYNAVAAIKFASSLAADTNSEPVYIKGIVSRTTDISAQYGNATFYISEDGKQENEFYVFRCLGLNNQKITSANEVQVGDEVIIYGPVVNYKGNTPETVQNKAYIYSTTNKNEGGNDGGSQGGEQTGDAGEYANNISYTLGSANAYDDGMATVNGVANVQTIKIGTSKNPGDFTIKTTTGKLSFYAVTWKGAGTAEVKFMDGSNEVKSVTVKANDGAAGNAPYTMSVSDGDKYEIELPADKSITVTSDKRIIFFGLQEK